MPRPKDWKGDNWNGRKPGAYEWYEIQDSIDYYKEFEKPKIICPAICQKANYTIDNENYFSNDKTTIIGSDDFYLLGILNSKIADYILHSIASTKQGGYFEYKPMYLCKIPIRVIDFTSKFDKSRHDQIMKLASDMFNLNKKSFLAKTEHEKTMIQRQIDATEKQIDKLVYELYGLTDDEIRIVEGV
jgi:hypothetical protein